MSEVEKKSIEEKRNILNKSIVKYLHEEYRVLSQTDTSAQLVKPKHFNLLFAIIFLFLWVLPLIIYVLYFVSKKDKLVYISVNDSGEVVTQN
jgi:hypothetical protein